jgi:leucyl aminopeptidase
MLKITASAKELAQSPKKYTRFAITEEPLSKHRFMQDADGTTTYRMGIGKFAEHNARTFRTAIRAMVQAAKGHELEAIALEFSFAQFPKLATYGEAWFWSTITENLALATYEFTTYKTKPQKAPLRDILLCGVTGKEAVTGFTRGTIVADYMNRGRDIANTPGCDLSPTKLGEAAKKLMAGTKVSVKVLGEKELTKLKMNALLAVGQGTRSETKFIIAEYWGAGKTSKQKPLVLVGKGITYDTGGLNVKPSGFMHDMHMDMSGGSAVLAALAAAAKLGVKKNIIALVPTAENAISDTAMRAGDIVTALNGKTIEILHTDAEGRMVLADALTYSERYSPRAILDVATLTGAALAALGQHASAIMTKHEDLQKTLCELGEASGDLVWPLPLWDEYKQHIKSHRADISNIATNFSRYGGSIEGGIFLSHFVPKNVPWAHLDIAPRMDSIPSDKLAKGSTGEPVRLLVAFLETY